MCNNDAAGHSHASPRSGQVARKRALATEIAVRDASSVAKA